MHQNMTDRNNLLKFRPNIPTNWFWRASIANQLRYGLVFLVVSSLLTTGGILIYSSFQNQLKQSDLLQQERSRAAAGEIDAYLKDLQRKLAYLSQVQGLTNLSPDDQRSLLEALTRHNDAYEIVGILNKSGEVVSAFSPYGQVLPYGEVLVDDPGNSPLFLQTFNQKQDYISIVETNPATNLPVVAFAVPIRNRQNQVDGVLFARINLKFLWSVMANTQVGETGYTYVIDNRNILIATKDSAPGKFKLQDISARSFVKVLRANERKPLTIYQGLKGVEVLGAIAPVKNVNWSVVVELPTAEAYAPVRSLILVMAGTLSLATLTAAGLGFLFSRRIVSPLQTLTAAAAQISDGNLDAQVRIEEQNELGVLAQSFNHMAEQLRESFSALEAVNTELEERVEQRTVELKAANQEITTLNESLKAENIRMSAELSITRQLQQMILPREEELKAIEGLEIASFMEPASEVGGDYYDILTHQGRVKIGIGDVTGHGLESGVLMIMVQTAVRTLMTINETDPVKFLNVLNQTIYDNVQRMGSDKNLTLALLDYQEGRVQLSGQHEEMIVVRGNGELERIDTIDLGFPIGLEADIGSFVAEAKVQLDAGDVLVLYTDGIVEAESYSRKQYGLERLCEVVTLNRQRSAVGIKESVINDLRQHIGEQIVYDDITLLVLKQK